MPSVISYVPIILYFGSPYYFFLHFIRGLFELAVLPLKPDLHTYCSIRTSHPADTPDTIVLGHAASHPSQGEQMDAAAADAMLL